ncbi:MAG: hypothetical protein H7Z72_20505 [Bacteroidetes bacterium]|nr:hypothetical protein [Fibrella sp.]
MKNNAIRLVCRKQKGLCIAFFLLISHCGYNQPVQDSITTISLKAIDGLQFDIVRFRVKPGGVVRLTLSNTDDMAHNLVITKPGAREEIVQAALNLGKRGPAVNYIPKSSKILQVIPVVNPEETGSITFTAPKQAGIYPYVCTFPGHGYVMYGAMYVTNGDLPDLKNDRTIPESRRLGELSASEHAGHVAPAPERFHPYQPVAPYLYRIFMPDASTASIAVSLSDDLSYCWDAGPCRLRYVWKGGFLDQKTLWPGKGDTQAKLTGALLFRDTMIYPLRMDTLQQAPSVDFKGYQLIDRYPEFHYTVDGIDVYELIHPQADGNGVRRRFKIPTAGRAVHFYTGQEAGVTYRSSTGKWGKGYVALTPDEAREFTITMTQKED